MKKETIWAIQGVLAKHKMLAKATASLMYAKFALSGHFPEKTEHAIELFTEKTLSPKEMRRLKKDILFTLCYNGASVDEYFRYDFPSLSEEGRRQYVGDMERWRRLRKLVDRESVPFLKEKEEAYKLFKEFYRREQIPVTGQESFQAFQDFCSRHSHFIVKPIDSAGGHGVYKETLEGKEVSEVFASILNHGDSVIEELIQQDSRMEAFHPGSVNTIRIVTCNRNGKVEIIQSSVRMGMGDSIVDNGCLSAGVDLETGMIISRGREAHGPGRYIVHPDTGVQILGNTIPEWGELVTFAKQLPLRLPKQRIIGWDLALSDRGWVMIEGNSCPDIQTLLAEGVGARAIFDEIERECREMP